MTDTNWFVGIWIQIQIIYSSSSSLRIQSVCLWIDFFARNIFECAIRKTIHVVKRNGTAAQSPINFIFIVFNSNFEWIWLTEWLTASLTQKEKKNRENELNQSWSVSAFVFQFRIYANEYRSSTNVFIKNWNVSHQIWIL